MANSYYIDIKHDGLKKYRRVTGRDKLEVGAKAAAQLAQWETIWQKQQNRENLARSKEQRKELALQRTKEAEEILSGLESMLSLAAKPSNKINWDSLIDKTDLNRLKPQPIPPPKAPIEPKESDIAYKPNYGLFARFVKSWADRKVLEAENKFKAAHAGWIQAVVKHKQQLETDKKQYEKAIKDWQDKKAAQIEQHKHIRKQKELYEIKDPDAIAEYCGYVLERSKYSIDYDKNYDIIYEKSNGLLVVDYWLPSIDAMPTLKEVRYIVSRDELNEIPLSENTRTKLYDDTLYKITLRSVYELYEADWVNALRSVVFNGWVSYIDRGTGHETKACILSLQSTKDVFLALNIGNVDARECFRQLKGIGSPKLHNLTPIAPIVTINKQDKRFVPAHDVVDTIDDSTNLASMDWEDFEYLIRDLFEKEFVSGGGEVKITRASRDGGVDAIAFDPDPIRGGKIVIQAKRYTNLVGVSAVRDLFGTVMNEGATKGILVTTSHYGADSYEFAKGKPLTLLDGNNLLFLLSKHGYKARIDINEAKKALNEATK
jgi:restriction system protein